jgi:hypothetical protein
MVIRILSLVQHLHIGSRFTIQHPVVFFAIVVVLSLSVPCLASDRVTWKLVVHKLHLLLIILFLSCSSAWANLVLKYVVNLLLLSLISVENMVSTSKDNRSICTMVLTLKHARLIGL